MVSMHVHHSEGSGVQLPHKDTKFIYFLSNLAVCHARQVIRIEKNSNASFLSLNFEVSLIKLLLDAAFIVFSTRLKTAYYIPVCQFIPRKIISSTDKLLLVICQLILVLHTSVYVQLSVAKEQRKFINAFIRILCIDYVTVECIMMVKIIQFDTISGYYLPVEWSA